MTKTKVISENQKRRITELKKQHPHLKIIDYDQFGKLFEPDTFPYKNKNRLYQDVSVSIDHFLDSFHYAFRELPFSYKNKIMASGNFNRFLDTVFTQFEYASTQKKDHDFQDHSFKVYLKLFEIGINGMIKTMPSEFQPYLKNQLKPTLSLMTLVGKYENLPFKYPSLKDKKKPKKTS